MNDRGSTPAGTVSERYRLDLQAAVATVLVVVLIVWPVFEIIINPRSTGIGSAIMLFHFKLAEASLAYLIAPLALVGWWIVVAIIWCRRRF